MARTAFIRPNRLRAEALQSSPILPCRRNSNPYESRYQKRRTADSLHRSWLQGGTKVIKLLPSKDLIMGQVKILKRGENLEPHSGEKDFPSSCLPDRFRPSSETETTRIHSLKLSELDMLYAGPVGFLVSPPPSSLPLPAFLSREKNNSFL